MKTWLKLVIIAWVSCVLANVLIALFGLGFIPITDMPRTKLLLEQGNNYMISFYLIGGLGVFGLGALLFSVWSRYVFVDQGWRKQNEREN